MVKQFLRLSGDKIEKKKFHFSKNPIAIDDLVIDKIIKSDRCAYEKYKKTDAKFFSGCKDGKIIRPLCIKFAKMEKYVNSFKETKYMFFEIKKNELLEKYNEICYKLSNIIEKVFDKQLAFSEKYLINNWLLMKNN